MIQSSPLQLVIDIFDFDLDSLVAFYTMHSTPTTVISCLLVQDVIKRSKHPQTGSPLWP